MPGDLVAGGFVGHPQTIAPPSPAFRSALAPHTQFPQRPGLRIRQLPQRGLHPFRIQRNHPRIEWIGLGQLPDRAREVAHLTGVDHFATGKPAAASAPTTRASYPPLASSTIRSHPNALRRLTNRAAARSSLTSVNDSPLGRTATTNSSFPTSIPTLLEVNRLWPGEGQRPLLRNSSSPCGGSSDRTGSDPGYATRRFLLIPDLAWYRAARAGAPLFASFFYLRNRYTRAARLARGGGVPPAFIKTQQFRA